MERKIKINPVGIQAQIALNKLTAKQIRNWRRCTLCGRFTAYLKEYDHPISGETIRSYVPHLCEFIKARLKNKL